MTNIGKPYEGKPHVRFDEEGLKYFSLSLYRAGESGESLQRFSASASEDSNLAPPVQACAPSMGAT